MTLDNAGALGSSIQSIAIYSTGSFASKTTYWDDFIACKNNDDDRIERDRYRFGGTRYGFRGPSTCGPSDMVYESSGAYAYPRIDKSIPPPPPGSTRSKGKMEDDGYDMLPL